MSSIGTPISSLLSKSAKARRNTQTQYFYFQQYLPPFTEYVAPKATKFDHNHYHESSGPTLDSLLSSTFFIPVASPFIALNSNSGRHIYIMSGQKCFFRLALLCTSLYFTEVACRWTPFFTRKLFAVFLDQPVI